MGAVPILTLACCSGGVREPVREAIGLLLATGCLGLLVYGR
jgi:hypothetical protein